MNPQFVNQPPPGPYGPPGQPGPGQFGGPPQTMNGPNQRPPGPGGYGPPKGMPPPPGSIQNGQGDQFGPRPGGPPGPGPMRGPPPPGPNMNQLSHQMGALGMGPARPGGPPPMGPGGNQPPRGPSSSAPNLPPTSGFGPPTDISGFGPPQPTDMSGFGPPRSMYNGQGPPVSNSSSGGHLPPTSQMSGAPPPPSGPGMRPPPPSSQAPPTSFGAPPYGPPSSQIGAMQPPLPPISSFGGPPPTSSFGGPPPTSSHGAPPPSSSSFGPPPVSSAPYGNQPIQPMSSAAPPSSTFGAPPGYRGPPPMSSSAFGQGMPPPPSGGAPIPGFSGPPPTSGYPGQGAPPPAGFPPGPPSGPPMSGGQPPAPGMPPMPPTHGAHRPPSPAGPQYGGPGGPMPGAQQPRKLDPDQMPSPIQVIGDDQRNRSGIYQTNQRGSVPPLVTTSFIVEDQGNATPRFLRSTMYNVPINQDMMKQAHLPFILTCTPFSRLHPKEKEPPIVDLGQLGPIRCNRCKAYMSPYMQFIDGGRRFQCAFCSCSTEVPPEYFQHLDHTGRRTDYYERPELCLGSYEFVATTDYCKDNKLPKPPAFIFMIDVSYNSVKSGLVHLMCERLKNDILVNLPKETWQEESDIRVGFVTYHKELHFYNVKGSLAQPQMLVVSDVEDVFVPLLDGFLVKLSESEAVIDSLLSQIPHMFAESRETEVVLGPVIEAGLDALKSAGCAGKLFVFHSSLPIGEAPGKLKNRDDRKLLGTDKEKTILTPQNKYYTKLGQDCVAAGCGVDIYLFPNAYVDIASIGEVPRITGGGLFKYQYFQADLDGNRLIEDLKNNVSRPIAFDAIMRFRTSTGIRPVDFYGNFYMSNTTDVELACVDCEKAITCEIKHDDKLSEAEGACVQAAVLYTSVSGQRRLRIINSGFNVCTQLADMFRNCELDVLINFMSKQAIRNTINTNPKQVREDMMNRCAQILACYRKNCASPSSAGQLILPECMKLLPVYTNCIIRSPILAGSADTITTDERCYLMHRVNAMSIRDSVVFFYPRLLPLVDLDVDSTALPQPIRDSYERLQDNGVYLVDNGMVMFMWIGMNVPMPWVQEVFGVQSAAQIDIDRTTLQDLDTPLSRRVRGIIKKIREERRNHMKLTIVRQRDKLEPEFLKYLVEDRGASGSASYVDFLCHIHKEIRNLLN